MTARAIGAAWETKPWDGSASSSPHDPKSLLSAIAPADRNLMSKLSQSRIHLAAVDSRFVGRFKLVEGILDGRQSGFVTRLGCVEITIGKRDSFVVPLFDKGPAHRVSPIFGGPSVGRRREKE